MRLLQLTGWLLTQTRQFEAAERCLGTALNGSADRLQGASTVSTMCWLLLRQGKLSEARELATQWADDTEPRLSRATPDELSAWGWLLLRLSAAAVRDNRTEEAEDALRLAHSAAVALGREFAPSDDFLRAFGPVTVTLRRTENAMVLDRPDVVLKLAAKIPTGGFRPTSNNRNRHLLDVANAYARTRRYGQAVETLASVREAALSGYRTSVTPVTSSVTSWLSGGRSRRKCAPSLTRWGCPRDTAWHFLLILNGTAIAAG